VRLLAYNPDLKKNSFSRVLMEKKVVNKPNFPRLVDLLRTGPGIHKHHPKSREPVSSGRSDEPNFPRQRTCGQTSGRDGHSKILTCALELITQVQGKGRHQSCTGLSRPFTTQIHKPFPSNRLPGHDEWDLNSKSIS
jgi:hypothetical protein